MHNNHHHRGRSNSGTRLCKVVLAEPRQAKSSVDPIAQVLGISEVCLPSHGPVLCFFQVCHSPLFSPPPDCKQLSEWYGVTRKRMRRSGEAGRCSPTIPLLGRGAALKGVYSGAYQWDASRFREGKNRTGSLAEQGESYPCNEKSQTGP
jgi:hypothetical protein